MTAQRPYCTKPSKDDTPAALMRLLRRLQAYVVTWHFTFVPTEDKQYEQGTEREARDIDDPDTNAVSSLVKDDWRGNRHIIAVDVDVPAYLISSSSEGHSHLYVDIPPASWEDYAAWLDASAKIGLLEPNYVAVSKARGHTDLRVPWVWKADQKKVTQQEMEEHHRAQPAPTPTSDDWPF